MYHNISEKHHNSTCMKPHPNTCVCCWATKTNLDSPRDCNLCMSISTHSPFLEFKIELDFEFALEVDMEFEIKL